MDDIDNTNTVVAVVDDGGMIPKSLRLRYQDQDRDLEAGIRNAISLMTPLKEVRSRSWSWVPNKRDRNTRR